MILSVNIILPLSSYYENIEWTIQDINNVLIAHSPEECDDISHPQSPSSPGYGDFLRFALSAVSIAYALLLTALLGGLCCHVKSCIIMFVFLLWLFYSCS